MRRGVITALLLIVVVIAVAFGATKLFFRLRSGGKAGLKVNSTPQSSVFINDEFKSKTPYDEKIVAGKYLIKLTPEGTDADTSSWQKEITLSPGLLTYINRELGGSDLTSAGEILSLEKTEGSGTQVSVVSTPDGASIALDGQDKGASPLVIDTSAGEHTLFVFAPGFIGRQVKIKATEGFKLNVDVQLALIDGEKEATESAESEEGEEAAGTKVKILDTPTGWLRVRESPSLSATESAKVDPGKEYPFLGEEEGWLKIEYEKDKEGWVSSRYAEKVEE